MSGKDANSQYFEVKGSGKKPYTVTINYDTGHWCTCRGMISKKSTWQEGAGRTNGTSCKHIQTIINSKFDGDWGEPCQCGSSCGSRLRSSLNQPGGKGKPRVPKKILTSPPPAPSKPTGRRAAIMHTRAKREKRRLEEEKASGSSLPLTDRIAALGAAREGANR